VAAGDSPGSGEPAQEAHAGAPPDQRSRRRRVVLTGGGTGGHVYPCLAIYDVLRRRGLCDEALYLGIPGRAEAEIVPRHGIPFETVPSAPIAGGSWLRKLRALTVILRGVLAAGVKLLRFRPRLVVAAGGYVAAPVILAAFLLKPLLRTRIVVDEQNLVPGLLNQFASLFADVVMVTFKETAYFIWSNRCVHVGYPVRSGYLESGPSRAEARRKLGMPAEAFVVVVFGGSMGSRSINRLVVDALEPLSAIPGLVVLHGIGLQSGGGYDAVADTTARLADRFGGRFDERDFTVRDGDGRIIYRGFRYLENLAEYQRAADLIVSRSGAGSLAEILALGRAALLVPKRGLPGNHQEMNAIAVAEAGGAEVVFERRDPVGGEDFVDAASFRDLVLRLAKEPERLLELERGAYKLSHRSVEDTVVSTVSRVMAGEDVDIIAQVTEPRFVRFQRQFDSVVLHLDRMARIGKTDSLYHRMYRIKLDEYLQDEDFLVVNKGIKLIGALRATDRYDVIRDRFPQFKGYLKRNALTALAKAEHFEPFFAELVHAGLRDGYYEVRREAIALFRRFHQDMAHREDIHQLVLERLVARFESWEVRSEAIRACVWFLPEHEFLTQMRRFRASRDIRNREALLEAIEDGLKAGCFRNTEAVRLFVKRMLVSTSEFQAHFRVRDRFVRVVEQLERMP
jgi:UDP-N-acetylglucosamine--N-acetylmuramyl-(pentapeptide) pyrophosphoryl-undecaprenol N-acetylglucosamine transferase